MDMIIILIIMIVCCSCCLSLSGGGGYYYYTQSTPDTTPTPVTKNTSGSSSNTSESLPNPASSNTSGSTTNSTEPNTSVSTTPKIAEKVVISRDKYGITDPDGIKTGVYKNIPNATFLLIPNLTNWTITIILKSDNYKQSYQGIIGNMYNKDVTTGWGMWINPNGKLHFRIENNTWDLNDLGSLRNNDEYQLIIKFTRTGYSFRLTNLKYFTKDGNLHKKFEIKITGGSGNYVDTETDPDILFRRNVLSGREVKKANPGANFNANFDVDSNVDNQPYFIPNFDQKIITDKGFITIGGWWENNNNEKFKGDINYLEIYKM
jgi:hypothetical protein